MRVVSLSAPAKLNLFLAITGRRPDGFHDLVSLVVKLDFGDTLTTTVRPAKSGLDVALTCSDPQLACDETNLVVRAARAFAAATGWAGVVEFALEKRIPTGAGLGGGSSDAATALRALNELTGAAMTPVQLQAIAAQIGSDCPLFLHAGPVVMRGRGERIEALPAVAADRLRGRRVLLFKPAFGIPTPWAYGQLAAKAPAGYLVAGAAEQRLGGWLRHRQAPAEAVLFNNMEPPAFAKFVALPTLLDQLRGEFGLQPRMSGSGSTCFALLDANSRVSAITATIREGWGDSAFIIPAQIA